MFSQLYLVAINRTEVGWQIVGRACSREAHWLKCCLMWTIVSASDKVVGWGGVACRVFYFIFIKHFFMVFTLTQRVQFGVLGGKTRLLKISHYSILSQSLGLNHLSIFFTFTFFNEFFT